MAIKSFPKPKSCKMSFTVMPPEKRRSPEDIQSRKQRPRSPYISTEKTSKKQNNRRRLPDSRTSNSLNQSKVLPFWCCDDCGMSQKLCWCKEEQPGDKMPQRTETTSSDISDMVHGLAGTEEFHEHLQKIPDNTLQVLRPLEAELEDDSDDEILLSILSRSPSPPQGFLESKDPGARERPPTSARRTQDNVSTPVEIKKKRGRLSGRDYRNENGCPFCDLSGIECNEIPRYHTANGVAMCSNYKIVLEPCEARAAKSCSFCKARRLLCRMTPRYQTVKGEFLCSNFGGLAKPFEQVLKPCLSCKASKHRCYMIWRYNSANEDVMCSACTVKVIKCVFEGNEHRTDTQSSDPQIVPPSEKLVFDPVEFMPFASSFEHTTPLAVSPIHLSTQQASDAVRRAAKTSDHTGLDEDGNPKPNKKAAIVCTGCRASGQKCDLKQKYLDTTLGENMCSRCTRLNIKCVAVERKSIRLARPCAACKARKSYCYVSGTSHEMEDEGVICSNCTKNGIECIFDYIPRRIGFHTLSLPSSTTADSAAKNSPVEKFPSVDCGTLADFDARVLAHRFYNAGLGDSERVEPTIAEDGSFIYPNHMPTTKGKWWSRSEEELDSMSRTQRLTVMSIARIMETTLGEQKFGKDRCSKCEVQGYECWNYSERARAVLRRDTGTCARCRINRCGRCSLSTRASRKKPA